MDDDKKFCRGRVLSTQPTAPEEAVAFVNAMLQDSAVSLPRAARVSMHQVQLALLELAEVLAGRPRQVAVVDSAWPSTPDVKTQLAVKTGTSTPEAVRAADTLAAADAHLTVRHQANDSTSSAILERRKQRETQQQPTLQAVGGATMPAPEAIITPTGSLTAGANLKKRKLRDKVTTPGILTTTAAEPANVAADEQLLPKALVLDDTTKARRKKTRLTVSDDNHNHHTAEMLSPVVKPVPIGLGDAEGGLASRKKSKKRRVSTDA